MILINLFLYTKNNHISPNSKNTSNFPNIYSIMAFYDLLYEGSDVNKITKITLADLMIHLTRYSRHNV